MTIAIVYARMRKVIEDRQSNFVSCSRFTRYHYLSTFGILLLLHTDYLGLS